MDLDTSLGALPGIGYYFSKKLESLGLKTVEDLIHYYPFRYDDFSNVSNVLESREGERITLQGEIWSIKDIYTRTRKVLTRAIFNDGTSPIELTWFNSPWLSKQIKTGDKLQVSGKISKYKGKLSIVAPVWEKIDLTMKQNENNSLHTGRLVPVYPETEGLTSKWIRTKVNLIFPKVAGQIQDPIPKNLTSDFVDLKTALYQIHFPDDWESTKKARERLSFDELFFTQLQSQKVRQQWRKKELTSPFILDQEKIGKFIKTLPFELTGAQKRVLEEISCDLGKQQPMNRLVQGEVGSGKTVVAAIAAYIACLNGLQTLFMAPTEILAFQHHKTLIKLLEPFGIDVGIYTGSKKKLGSGVVVGTHALLSKTLDADNVGLVIVDEQQRFGVEQRSLLRSKAKVPHFLTMTATPIPRTVALTIYGDLDVSVIDELPRGRQKIKTYAVPAKKRNDAYKFIDKKVKEGDQVYVITPLIEESETLLSAKAATVEHERLQKKVFPKLKLGLLHGRLKPKEKDQVLNDFKDHKTDILVSTSVVEVGVDVPNATIMLIENAERFGLAQLHQFRGRVGRGNKESFCLLFDGTGNSDAFRRLKNLEKIDNGLELAELDLKIRGSGQIHGTIQSGRLELKIASLSDLPLIEKARNAAKKILEDDPGLEKYPPLRSKINFTTVDIMPD